MLETARIDRARAGKNFGIVFLHIDESWMFIAEAGAILQNRQDDA
jgi:hypothetical protein